MRFLSDSFDEAAEAALLAAISEDVGFQLNYVMLPCTGAMG